MDKDIRLAQKLIKFWKRKSFDLPLPTYYPSDLIELEKGWKMYYGIEQDFCHLLGKVPDVVSVRLFLLDWVNNTRNIGLPHINHGSNILFLSKPIAQVFETGQVVFLYEKDSREYRLKILDGDLRTMMIHTDFPDFPVKCTYGYLEGTPLTFLNDQRPNLNCLSFHALIARHYAYGACWIEKEQLQVLDSDDVWNLENEKTNDFIETVKVVFSLSE